MPERDNHDRLSSWKEIASYLNVETRTVMRWEKERGLPVRRVPGGGRRAVYALRAEIDAWLAGQPAEPQTPPAVMKKPSRLTVGMSLALAVVAALTLWAVLKGRAQASAETPVRVTFAGDTLTAWNATDGIVWQHRFPSAMDNPGGGAWRMGAERARLVDLDDDGQKEVLAVVHVPQGAGVGVLARTELDCFSSGGTLLWRYVPEAVFRFAGRDFSGPWVIYDLMVSAEPRGKVVWLAVNHHTWWPSYVVRLDGEGRPETRFVNTGSTWSLGSFKKDEEEYILVGGFNNEPYQGSLAVLKADQEAATSPPGERADSAFRCEDCPPGLPVAYLLFPRSELNRLKGVPNFVTEADPVGEAIQVQTLEDKPGTSCLYLLTPHPDWRLLNASFSDGYWEQHRQLEREGRIKHPAEICPGRTWPKSPRIWTPPPAGLKSRR